jgi:hypothetical protein
VKVRAVGIAVRVGAETGRSNSVATTAFLSAATISKQQLNAMSEAETSRFKIRKLNIQAPHARVARPGSSIDNMGVGTY